MFHTVPTCMYISDLDGHLNMRAELKTRLNSGLDSLISVYFSEDLFVDSLIGYLVT